jgi:hypothetical protein
MASSERARQSRHMLEHGTYIMHLGRLEKRLLLLLSCDFRSCQRCLQLGEIFLRFIQRFAVGMQLAVSVAIWASKPAMMAIQIRTMGGSNASGEIQLRRNRPTRLFPFR